MTLTQILGLNTLKANYETELPLCRIMYRRIWAHHSLMRGLVGVVATEAVVGAAYNQYDRP